jgi:hypothetical protein
LGRLPSNQRIRGNLLQNETKVTDIEIDDKEAQRVVLPLS